MRKVISAAIVKDKQLLIVRSEAAWILVGGKPENGESALETLSREVRDELSGTQLKNVRKYGDFVGRTPHTGDIRLFEVYLADIHGELGAPSAEVKEATWYRPGEDYVLSPVTSLVVEALKRDKYL